MATNLQTTLYERTLYAPEERSDPPAWFNPTPPALPVTSLPVYPGWGTGTVILNSYERAEVDRYIANPTDSLLASLRLPDAIAKANEFKTYFATPAFQAWFASKESTRRAQWKFFNADALINAKGTVSQSADTAGGGSGAPPDYQPPGTNVP
jgi:hypothetical protein